MIGNGFAANEVRSEFIPELRFPAVGQIRVGIAHFAPRLLASLGYHPQPVVEEAGLTLRELRDPDNLISYAAVVRLINVSAQKTCCPYFGLLLGQYGGLATIGIVGKLMRSASNTESALCDLVSFLHVHDRGAAPNLEVLSDISILSYAVYETVIDVDNTYDAAIAVGFRILRTLCGPDWRPMEVRIPHRRPDNVRPYERFFEAPIQFNSDRAALVFSSNWLKHKLPNTDQGRYLALRSELERQERGLDFSFREKTKRLLISNAKSWSADEIAGHLGMHRRTLSRRLRSEHTSLIEIIDEIRLDAAIYMLAHTDTSLAQIASALNYSEASAFTRSFRRWMGTSPSEWRKSHHPDVISEHGFVRHNPVSECQAGTDRSR